MAGYIIEASAASGRYKWQEPSKASDRRRVQDHLRRLGRYNGPSDGAWGPNTIIGIQRSLRCGDYYHGPIDGAVGKNTVLGMIKYANTTDVPGIDWGITWGNFLTRISKVTSTAKCWL